MATITLQAMKSGIGRARHFRAAGVRAAGLPELAISSAVLGVVALVGLSAFAISQRLISDTVFQKTARELAISEIELLEAEGVPNEFPTDWKHHVIDQRIYRSRLEGALLGDEPKQYFAIEVIVEEGDRNYRIETYMSPSTP